MTESTASRRKFAGKLLGAGALAFAAGSGKADAQVVTSDIDIVNYALSLENLEAAFYNQGLTTFSASDFAASTILGGLNLGSTFLSGVSDYLKTIRDHENAHVIALNTVIKGLGGTPVAPCTYNFGVKTVDDFIKTAALLENTGVKAYDGAIKLLKNPDLIQAGATIATVEARHAAFLNLLNGTSPFPDAFDTPVAMADILKAAGGFITSCPTTTVTPPVTTPPTGSKNITVLQNQIVLDLTKFTSATGKPASFLIRNLTGGGTASIGNSTTANPAIFFNSGLGTYLFEITVVDTAGVVTKDNLSIYYQGR
jgi:hypothetical protein